MTEFRVNTFTTNPQRAPSVAMDADGDFVVAWTSYGQDGSLMGIYAQRYNAAGVAQGDEFRVNTFTTGQQRFPSVAMDASGDFVVAWQSNSQDGSGDGIYAQRYNASGVAQGDEFRVNTTTSLNQRDPAVAMDADGDFVVTWESDTPTADGTALEVGVFAQRYNAAGEAQGGEFRIANFLSIANFLGQNSQFDPSVAMDADGDFVVAFQSYDSSGNGIYVQRYNAAGVAQDIDVLVNTSTANQQATPSVAMDANGNFVVTWASRLQDGSSYGIYAQRFNATGVAQGAEFRVNTFTTDLQVAPSVAMDADGDFVVTWQSYGQDGAGYGIYAQRFNASGVAQGAEFRVNTVTASNQRASSVAMDADGDFVVAWQSYGQDGPSDGIYAQRFGGPPALSLAATDAGKAEGDSGSTGFTFTVTRTGDTSGTASADWAVTGAAVTGADFAGGALPSGSVTFAAGETSQVITVNVAGDTAFEADEAFTVTLSGVSGARLGTATAVGTIQNDDALPVLAIAATDAGKAEGSGGSTGFTFTVTRTGDTSGASSADWAVSGAAVTGADFAGGELPSGSVTFAAGETSQVITVNVAGDTEVEANEAFTVTLSAASGATLGTATADGTILDDDASIAIAATDAVKREGNTGVTAFTFTVTRIGDTSGVSSADWTIGGVTVAGEDFAGGELPAGTVTFAAGETSQVITVNVAGDTAGEASEDFTITLSGASGATLGTATATGTILNDDPVSGGLGNDTLLGGAGEDTLLGLRGQDLLIGDEGGDLLDGGVGDDTALGGGGNDTLLGRAGDDELSGGDGHDSLAGSAGNDELFGEEGNDTLIGGDGGDVLFGGAGDDVINTGAGADIVQGGAGRDRIISDVGGPGKRFLYASETEGRDVITQFERGTDRIALQFFEEADLGHTEVATSFGKMNNTGVWMVYVAASETLWVDLNGTGAGERYAIARLMGVTTLERADLDIGF